MASLETSLSGATLGVGSPRVLSYRGDRLGLLSLRFFYTSSLALLPPEEEFRYRHFALGLVFALACTYLGWLEDAR